ncbi:hypothetical protein ACHAWO_007429 [Cyclotella atomus]|uniref:Peptidase M12B domain-containing protein n=1 Tax=Cyclotella atomus TaxID=382360 RepID=A0ABD3NSB8_9STRA
MIRLSLLKLFLLISSTHAAPSTIGASMRSARANGHASFQINAEKADGSTFQFNVVEASIPALNANTQLKLADGSTSSIGAGVLHTLLVSDGDNGETFALLAVDEDDNVHGIVDRKNEKPMKIRQNGNNGKAFAEEETNLVAPDWSCGTDHVDAEGNPFHRDLEEDHHHDHEHEHDHRDHSHHDHSHHHKIESAMQSLSKQLRGTKINPLNKQPVRHLQSSSNYNYQVDLYMEIDNAFVTRSGGTMQTALNYINSLVTAANVVYEVEIDTHLHVAFVELNTVYDLSTSTSDALSIMRTTYANSVWHTAGIDLHHALLGKGLGGGIAYVGVLCRSDYGYGLTASIGGSFVSLDYRVVWDLVAFMHELGHNFNSPHSHDTNGYNPAIDTCGTTCPASSTNTKWSTIMSYCHLCSGSYANQMYSFGGSYSGAGTKTDVNSWINDVELMNNGNTVRASVDPRREAHRMYYHASTRGSCLAVPVAPATPAPVTPKPTNAPVTPKPTNAPVTSKPTNAPVSSAPVTPSPTDAPVTSAPVTPKPTDAPVTAAPVTPQPTDAPVTASPTKAPITNPPTTATNCEDPNITQTDCIAAPNCEWIKVKRNGYCRFSTSNPNPPSPTPPTTPNPTGGGGGTCDGVGASCTASSGNCCNGCQMKGKWANTCK